MKAIKITVTGTQAHLISTPDLTAGSIGQPVEFIFDNAWDRLNKTAVFRAGDVTKDCVNIGNCATVPWECMEKPGEILQIGIYGTNADGSLAIPTAMTKIAIISAGADPSGDESTDPTLPVWEQINKTAIKTVNGKVPDENGNVEMVPCITVSGAPTTATAGAVGCLYMDTATGELYKCTAVSGTTYTWAALVEADVMHVVVNLYRGGAIEVNHTTEEIGLALRSHKQITCTFYDETNGFYGTANVYGDSGYIEIQCRNTLLFGNPIGTWTINETSMFG